MHRYTPLMTAFRSYVAGGARSVVDKVDDGSLMQEMAGNFLKGETREKVEAPQNYGFSSVVRAATKGKDGQIEESAEAFISFMGGNRSFPVAGVMDDRRYRPMGMKPGENSQYDDLGQMTLMRRTGLYLLTLDGPDDSQQDSGGAGGAQGKAGDSGGGGGKNVERMASLRHVEKQKQERQKPQGTPDASGKVLSAEAWAEQTAAIKKKNENYKHEGDSVNTEVRCTKGRIEFRVGDTVAGSYDKGSKTWLLTAGGNAKRSLKIDDRHVHIKFDDNTIWVDKAGCWSSKAIELKDDPESQSQAATGPTLEQRIAQLEARVRELESRS